MMIKTYSAKSEAEAVEKASQDLNVDNKNLFYSVIFEKKSLFSRKVEITAYSIQTVQEFINKYLMTLLTNMEFKSEIKTDFIEGRILVDVNTDNNSILIGKNGVILRALNILVKNAVSSTFKKRFELSIDINSYRENRYMKVKRMAIQFGKNVQRSRIDMHLDPMPADERKVIHHTLTQMNYVRTESVGEGRTRHLTIIYDPKKVRNKSQN
jgi:Predicted RNA-binding protein